ncbi:hypothetical protein FQK02_07180 [Xanthomonas vasicola]|nr:hypothetical protein C7Y61_05005 [Xanthomonas vasicola pv. vasculorum]TWQ08623.1 hypothetical protein FQK02_07180 [Xanthomonas vasicola]RNK66281.1 hypothetical protein C9394_13160 [Xanthomonas vasicola pv. vasculorum]RNK80765.1 hypothetical protein C9392_14225 [Xanthomonas vasicola pv. vasculorum]TWQ39058.1 hypothetical protein FQJ99_02555 [Xanthomonas vasicola]
MAKAAEMHAVHADPSAGSACMANASALDWWLSSCSSSRHGLSGSGHDSAGSHAAISAVGG